MARLLTAIVGAALAIAPLAAQPELKAPTFSFSAATGLGQETGVARRDPSDVIQVSGTYYVWYTKVESTHKPALYPEGYAGEVWYATSRDGQTWQEQGRALGAGASGTFDSHGVLTPNILVAGGKYYLFYTGVKPTPGGDGETFENNATNDFTAIGLATSSSPSGPFVRAKTNPILTPSDSADQWWDSYRVDDACLIVRGGKYWLYYKGGRLPDGRSAALTQMGVAIAARPEGPYTKHSTNPVLDSGHEVLVWPHRSGVAALIAHIGPQARTMQYATDGISFQKVGDLPGTYPQAPGAFRPDAFANTRFGRGFSWGISMLHVKDPYLVRYDTNLAVPHADLPPPPPPPPPSPPPGGGGGFGFGGGGGAPRTSAPSAPRNLTAEAGDGEVVLTWDAPEDDGGSAITDYEYRNVGRDPWTSTGSTDTTYTVSGLDNSVTYAFEVRAVNRAGKSFSSKRVEATPEAPPVFTLDFPHFANGGGITSEVVLLNVGAAPILPVLYFSDRQGKPIAADSVVDLTDDLEVQEDGGLTIRTAIEPLGELTVATHGRGVEVSGSVRVVAEGAPLGGVLRYGVPGVGVTGVGAGIRCGTRCSRRGASRAESARRRRCTIWERQRSM